MSPHEIHKRNRGIVKNALENAGYKCAQPSADAKGVDFVVTPPEGGDSFDLQVRSRLYLIKKHLPRTRKLRIAFPDKDESGKDLVVYLYHLNEMLEQADNLGRITHTKSWKRDGVYHQSPTPDWARESPVLHRIPRTQKE